MKATHLYRLLRVISTNGNIYSLAHHGFRLSQVAEMLFQAEQENYIDDTEDGYVLTTLGKEFIHKNSLSFDRGGSRNWIVKQSQFQVTPIGFYDIFLPRRF